MICNSVKLITSVRPLMASISDGWFTQQRLMLEEIKRKIEKVVLRSLEDLSRFIVGQTTKNSTRFINSGFTLAYINDK